MQTFKKAAVSFISVLLCLAVLFTASFYYSDKFSVATNKEQCTIPEDTNYIFCGASQCEMAFIPDEIDRNVNNIKSYNLSVQSIRLCARYEVIKNLILSGKKIKTVVLELSYDSFERKENHSALSDIVLRSYYKSLLSREYILKYTYNRYLVRNEILNFKSFFTYKDGKNSAQSSSESSQTASTNGSIGYGSQYKDANRGFVAFESKNVRIAENEIKTDFESEKYESIILEDNVELVNKIVDLCKDNDVEIIIAVVPLSDAFIWKHTSLDSFYNYLSDFSKTAGCRFYDFNLLKNRYSVFNDKESFYNESHLSYVGAKALSKEYCKVINKVNSGEDVCDLFYSSYQEMKADSPYMKY